MGFLEITICNQVLFPGDKVIMENDNDKYIITHLFKDYTVIISKRGKYNIFYTT